MTPISERTKKHDREENDLVPGVNWFQASLPKYTQASTYAKVQIWGVA